MAEIEDGEIRRIDKYSFNLGKKVMLYEVCDWIEDNIYDYLYINRDFNEADYKHEFIEDLRKAMEDKI